MSAEQPSKSSFIEKRTIAIPAASGGRPGTITASMYGRVFACTEASAGFEMNFNDGEWFGCRKGVEWALVGEDRFNRLKFRNAGAVAVDVEFYGGNFFWHENVVVPVMVVAKTKAIPHTATSIGAAASIIFNTVPAGLSWRKGIVITNNDAAIDLEVEADDPANPGTWLPCGIVFAKQAWYLETSDKLRLRNPGGAPVNFRALETFYNSQT